MRPAQATDRTLEDTARAFFLGMAAERPDENRAAMARIVPTADDLGALVPGQRDALWAVWGPEAERLVAEAPNRSHEYRDVLPIVRRPHGRPAGQTRRSSWRVPYRSCRPICQCVAS